MRAVMIAGLALVAAGCGTAKPAAPAGAPSPTVAPMKLSGQRVLVLPLQAASGLSASRDQLTTELIAALSERDAGTTWVAPDALRRTLRMSPGYAPDPGALPADPFVHRGQRIVGGALGGVLRRYGAVTDARLVLVPRDARFVASPAGGGAVRLRAALVDSRSDAVVWWGEVDGEVRPQADSVATTSAATALAARMLARDEP